MMRRPQLLWVGGPPGAGKTLLLERLAASWRSRALGWLRVVEDPAYDEVRRDDSAGREGERMEAAGAVGAARVPAPATGKGSVTAVLHAAPPWFEDLDVVAVEGGWPMRRAVDLAVFVLPAVGDGEALTVRERREIGRLSGREALSLLLRRELGPEADAAYVEGRSNPATAWEEEPGEAGTHVDEESFDAEEVVDSYEIPDEVGWALIDLFEHGRPVELDGTWLRDGLNGLEEAQLAVVNVVGGGSVDAAQRTAAEVLGLREQELLGPRGVRHGYDAFPRAALLADLAERRDEGTTKVVASIKRRLRRR